MASGERVPNYYREAPPREETEAVTEFYEDDEPVADVVAAFERAPKGVTAEPTDSDDGPADEA